MQAERKAIDPVQPRGVPGEPESWAPRNAPGAVSPQSSPAHLMLRGLAARLTETGADAAAMPIEQKWPMPARLTAMVTLSLVGWAVLGWVALALF